MDTIGNWMTTKLVTVKPRDTVAHARGLAFEHRVNQLLVVQDGRLVGLVSDRDLRDAYPSVFDQAKRDMSGRHTPLEAERMPVEMVMSRDPHTLRPDATLADAAKLMRRQRIGAVPVVDRDGHPLGIVARADVLDAYVRLVERQVERRAS